VGARQSDFRQIADDEPARIGRAESSDDAGLIITRRHVWADRHQMPGRVRFAGLFRQLLFRGDVRLRKVKLIGFIEVCAGYGHFKGCSGLTARWEKRGQTSERKLS